ncbi:MAG: hypothetical protein JXA10_12345, partial [Anaerolineae bacterium]|nr:hypothetical protein [Anaerolineae bacterium]
MTSNSPRKQPPPIYVWLFAAYPIIELYGRNIDLLAGQEVLIVLALVLLGVSVIYGALRRWTKSPTRAAPLTLLITALFFSYGHVHTLLLQQLNRTESMHLICYPAAFMVFGLMAYFVWKKHRTLHKAIAYFNLTAIILLAISVAKIADFLYYDTLTKTETLPPVTVALDASETQPDVYYIILDGYSRGDWLETWFGFNNDDFLQELTARGFYIADRSCSNYIQTHLSIPSVLSMAYIEPTHASNLSEIRSLRYMNSYVRQNNRVGNVFEALGYTTIHFATHYSITAYNHDADVVIDFGPSGSFITDHADATEPYWNALLPTTLYSPFFTYQDVLAGDIYSYRSPYRVLMSLDELKAIPEYPEPTFTLAHIIKPHDPFSFDRDGNIVDDHPGWIPETDMGISRGNQRYI